MTKYFSSSRSLRLAQDKNRLPKNTLPPPRTLLIFIAAQVWGTDEGDRTAHCCRNPISFSPTDQLCRMKALSATRTLRALPRAASFSAPPTNKSFLAASSTTISAIRFRCGQFLGTRRNGSCSAAQLPDTSKPSLPSIEFPQGPRPPHPRAATPKRLYRTREEIPAPLHDPAKRRVPIKL